MADYRAISQEYAQGAIKAAALLNSGAAVAVLAQLKDLPGHMGTAMKISMVLWIVGAILASLAWSMAFGATRYVDKAADEKVPAHITTANRFQTAALVMIYSAFLLFGLGAVSLALAY